jgi:hypothetical protein
MQSSSSARDSTTFLVTFATIIVFFFFPMPPGRGLVTIVFPSLFGRWKCVSIGFEMFFVLIRQMR